MALFSGSNGRKGSIATSMYLVGERDRATNLLDQAYGSSRDYLNQNRGIYSTALGSGLNSLRTGFQDARAAVRGGYNNADSLLKGAYNSWTPLLKRSMAGFDAYGDATGANGAEGSARARQNFESTFGFTKERDEAIDGAMRAMAAGGMAASGNAVVEAQDRATDLARRNIGSYVERLSPYLSLVPQIMGQQTSIAGARADNATNYGARIADLLAREGVGTAELFGRDAQLQGGINTALAALETAGGQSKAAILLDAANQIGGQIQKGFEAGDQAAANRFGAIMGGLNLGARLLGSGGGGGGGLFGAGGSASEAASRFLIPSL